MQVVVGVTDCQARRRDETKVVGSVDVNNALLGCLVSKLRLESRWWMSY